MELGEITLLAVQRIIYRVARETMARVRKSEITLLAVRRIIYRVARGTMVWLGMTSYIIILSLTLSSLSTNMDEERIWE